MYLLILFVPFLSYLSLAFFGRYIGSKGSVIISSSLMLGSFLLSVLSFYEVGLMGSPTYIRLATWFSSEALTVNWGLMFDSLTVSMCCIVTFVSMLVHIYSIEYMSHDPHQPRFMSYLSLFTFFMLILVTADNYVQMFLGWEGVGLCSYLLINFWFTRVQANKAAIKAMIMNRIGDFSLVMGLLLMYHVFKSLDYAVVAIMVPYCKDYSTIFLNLEFNSITLICTFLFIGAVGKSAQLGLHTWLPDAMEGPTPVSALIHAATMVTAGIFLIIRSSFIFEYAENVLCVLSVVGAMTAFFASTVGLVQNDLKKVIAYSTCSQLGYMMFSCGMSDYSAAFFHLSNHAFFKALLFLCAGSVIHAVNDEQDMRKMGGLKNLIPFTYSCMTIGSLALIGFPFLSGFYSKDLILELAYGKFSIYSHFSYVLGTFGAFFTSFYSTRLLCLTFLVKPNGYKSVIQFAKETYKQIFLVLFILCFPSVLIGFYTKELFTGAGNDFFGTAIYNNPSSLHVFDAEFIVFIYKILPLFFSFLGAFSSFFLYNFKKRLLFSLKVTKIGRSIYTFLNKKWFFDKVYNELFGQFFFHFGYSISYKKIDRGIFEMLGPFGLSFAALKVAKEWNKLQTKSIYHYMLIALASLTFMLLVTQILIIGGTYFIDYRVLILMITSSFFL